MLGMTIITYQSVVSRTPHHTILVDTCTGEHKGHSARSISQKKERLSKEVYALGVTFEIVDYVFCSHLHIDQTAWNISLHDGRWVPMFPNAKYVFHKDEYSVSEAEYPNGANPYGTVF